MFRFVITGHSLGAGTAILIAMDILAGNVPAIVPAGIDVKCVALAPPPVYRLESKTSKLPEVFTEKIHIFINNRDCVPNLSLATVANLAAKLRAIGR